MQDVALGSDGTIILCTKSGHVFIRSRIARTAPTVSKTSHPNFKFQRIPYLQRVFRVCANSTGSFGALRADAKLDLIPIQLNTLSVDLDGMRPWATNLHGLEEEGSPRTNAKEMSLEVEDTVERSMPLLPKKADDDDDEGPEDSDVVKDIEAALELCDIIARRIHVPDREEAADLGFPPALWRKRGADAIISVGSANGGKLDIHVHRAILKARCLKLERMFGSRHKESFTGYSINFTASHELQCPRLSARGCLPMTILVLLNYLYTDNLIAIWDRRISLAISDQYNYLSIDRSLVRQELIYLASPSSLDLPVLASALEATGRKVPVCTISKDFGRLFEMEGGHHDVLLSLEDGEKKVKAHSVLLRARSPFFAAFLDRDVWTLNRRTGTELLEVDLAHLKWRPMSFVFKYIYEDASMEMFEKLGAFIVEYSFHIAETLSEFIQNTDQFLDFMFEVISCSVSTLQNSLLHLFTKPNDRMNCF